MVCACMTHESEKKMIYMPEYNAASTSCVLYIYIYEFGVSDVPVKVINVFFNFSR
jgi:hypothetical protein